MNFDKLFNMIDDRKKRLDEIISIEDKNLVVLEDFITNNSFININGLFKMDYNELISIYLYCISGELDIDKIYELVEKSNFLIEPEFTKVDEIFQVLRLRQENKQSLIGKLIDKFFSIEEEFDSVKRLYDIYGGELERVIRIVLAIQKMNDDYEYHSKNLDEIRMIDDDVDFSDKRKGRIIKNILKEDFYIDRVCNDLSSVINREYSNLKSRDKKKKKEARKAIMNYTMLVSNLKKYKKEQLLNKNIFNNMVNMIEDEDILREFLIQINNLQKEHFSKLEVEYLKLSSDSSASIQVMLNNYNIDFNKLSVNLKNKLLKEERRDLEEFLRLIKEIGIIDFEMICYLLENSSNVVVSGFIDLIKDGVFTLEFLINNKELFEADNYKKIIEKFKLFKDEGINYRLFVNDLDVYLVDYNELFYNINVLKQYKLLVGLNRLSSFDLFKDDNLEVKIDLLLELGYERILEENINLLNVAVSKIKKLYILKGIGMLPNDYENLVNVLNNKTFLDSISDVDSYLFNIVNYKVDSNITMDGDIDYSKFYSNERVLEVGGVILSLNRVKRNISRLGNGEISDDERFIFALLNGAILSEEEYNLILNNLSDIKRKVY